MISERAVNTFMLLTELFLIEQPLVTTDCWYNPSTNVMHEVDFTIHAMFVEDNPELFGLDRNNPEHFDQQGRVLLHPVFEQWLRITGPRADPRSPADSLILGIEGNRRNIFHPNTQKLVMIELTKGSLDQGRIYFDIRKEGHLDIEESVNFRIPHQRGEMIRWFKGV